jgi:hypothetical protein
MTTTATATMILHESQNALPDVRDEYPLTIDASCAVMLAPISSSREGEDGTRFQANTSTSSSSSSSRRTYLRCAPRAASTIRTRRLLPPVGYLVLDGRMVVEYISLLPPGNCHGRVTLHFQHSLDRGNTRGRGQLGKPFERFYAPVGGVLLLPRRTQRIPRATAGSRPPPPTPPPSPLNSVIISRRAVIGWLSRCVASPPLISLHRLRPSSLS